MSKPLRPINEIRAAAASGSLRKQAKAILDREAEINSQRAALIIPSQRRAVVEEYFGRPLEKLSGDDRATAENVCVLHDRESVIRFGEYTLASRALPTEQVLRDFNRAYATELEREIANVTEQLGAIYGLYGFGFNPDGNAMHGYATPLDACLPVIELKRRLGLARDAAISGEGGAGGVASAFNGIL